VKLAAESARSVERHNPTLPTTVHTTAESPGDAFDRVVRLDDPLERAGDSILTAGQVPYDRNLYLDADAPVRDDISDVFELLETTDLALAQNNACARLHADVYDDAAVEVPEAFTEYNSGVVAYNDCADVIALFDEWHANTSVSAASSTNRHCESPSTGATSTSSRCPRSTIS
jgi:hypothetical protein